MKNLKLLLIALTFSSAQAMDQDTDLADLLKDIAKFQTEVDVEMPANKKHKAHEAVDDVLTELRKLREQLGKVQAEGVVFKKELDTLAATKITLQAQNDSQKTANAKLSEINSNLRATNTALNTEKAQWATERDTLTQEKKDLTDEKTSLTAAKKSLEETVKTLFNELKASHTKAKQLAKELSEIKGKIDQAKAL